MPELVTTGLGIDSATVVASDERRHVFALPSVVAASHLTEDAPLAESLRAVVRGLPLTQYQPPTPEVYLSTDIWPSLLTGTIALAVWQVHRRRNREG